MKKRRRKLYRILWFCLLTSVLVGGSILTSNVKLYKWIWFAICFFMGFFNEKLFDLFFYTKTNNDNGKRPKI